MTPDSKDWTWVLDAACPQCGLDTREVPPEHVAGRLRDNAAAWPAVLQRPDVRVRPDPLTWSPLEYGCHVRDVLRRYDARLQLMLEQDDPLYADWDQDETAVSDRYGEQDPATVACDLVAAGEALAARFDSVTGSQWRRPGRRSDGARFTVATLARYVLHDPVHHLHDVAGAGGS